MRSLLPAAALVAALALAAAPASAHRTPKGAEAAALKRVGHTYVVAHGHYSASQRLIYRVRVSTVDPRMAAVMAGGEYDAISMVLRHANGRWRVVSTDPCGYGPAAVRADLWDFC
jgi:hypothetical protein